MEYYLNRYLTDWYIHQTTKEKKMTECGSKSSKTSLASFHTPLSLVTHTCWAPVNSM